MMDGFAVHSLYVITDTVFVGNLGYGAGSHVELPIALQVMGLGAGAVTVDRMSRCSV